MIQPRFGKTGRIDERLDMLGDGHVNAYVCSNGENTICVDSGFGGR